ncbi:protein tyrosine phosphatase [Lujinxingia litoralis]|uniref:protein-tyrosine-phosphatase n=2 Tax=Lujinxingia litoralis TaxID=2211119 RepID=A0A328CBK2_9DELT|nr:protein tyrosine phosphatase [Lujinxingia litoralis]
MFFCLGNICRSPLAEALFRYHVEERDLGTRFHIESSGTSAYHVGEPPDPGSVRVAQERLKLDISHQRAQQLSSSHFAAFDWLVAMDRSNLTHARPLSGTHGKKLLLLRDFEPQERLRGQNVPDPWGGGTEHFEQVFEMVERCTLALLEDLLSH